jgi:selenocysteine lyase/cysteine desulfurase
MGADGPDHFRVKSSAGHTRRKFLTSIVGTSMVGVAGTASASDQQKSSGATQNAQSEYLLAPGLTYLNTASLGPTPRTVLNRTLETWNELELDPVYMAYGDGPVLAVADRTRDQAAALMGCTADEILITRSTTDAMNSLAQGIRLAAGDRVLTTDQEHEGGSAGWHYRARRDGVHIDVVPVAVTDHDPDEIVRRFAAAITSATKVISVSHVISSTGLRMPIAEIAALARDRGALCIVDGAQAVGQIDVDVKSLGCHAYATSGHKWLLGPKGTGVLYVNRDAVGIQPVQWEDGRKFIANSTGVGSLPLAVGLGAAIEAIRARRLNDVEGHNIALRNRAYAGLKQIPKLDVVSTPPGPLATALVAARLPVDIDSRQVRDTLRQRHHVVIKMVEKRWFNGIRLSPHIFNTEQDIDAALRAIRTVLG